MWCLLLLLLVAAAAVVAGTVAQQPVPAAVRVALPGGAHAELAVHGGSAFRLSFASAGSALAAPIASPMLAELGAHAPATTTASSIKTAFGSLSLEPSSGVLTLADGAGRVLSRGPLLGAAPKPLPPGKQPLCPAFAGAIDGHATGSPSVTRSGQDCCAVCKHSTTCGGFTYDTITGACALKSQSVNITVTATNNSLSAVVSAECECYCHATCNGHCWVGPHPCTAPPPPGPPGPAAARTTLHFGRSASSRFYGSGEVKTSPGLAKNRSAPHVTNTDLAVSRFWSTDGYAALGVSPFASDPQQLSEYPASWDATTTDSVAFSIMGSSVDIYLMPAATAFEGLRVHWALTGAAALPPRYAFGFMACRWGWQNESYIEDMLGRFRTGEFPIDAWISDFEWYTPEPDYSLAPGGTDAFKDFDFDRKGDCRPGQTAGCQGATFPEPEKQLLHYREDLHLRFGGIRKPRLGNRGNLTMAGAKGWLLTGGNKRNLNYSMPAVRDWYSQNQQWYHRINGGAAPVEFWWNDEGETDYFTFHWWNVAQLAALRATNKTKRAFTINRSFSPGMQRLGAAVWTGDIHSSWAELARTGSYLTNWVLAGIPYIACDTGGFNQNVKIEPSVYSDLLVRWYQLSVHLPIMRVHSTHSALPHFPFLYGETPGDAMRAAMNRRYQLVPYHYSNAHAMYAAGRPMMRPLLMDFPSDAAASELTTQWMDGDALLVAPIVTSPEGPEGNVTAMSRTVYLPGHGETEWFAFNTTTAHSGGENIVVEAALAESPLYARAGSIVPLAPLVQYTDALPGGALDVHVYAGKDSRYVMTEDDGETIAYERGEVRSTVFSWTDATKTLSWSVNATGRRSSAAAAPQFAASFTELKLTLFVAGGARASSKTVAIGDSGSINA